MGVGKGTIARALVKQSDYFAVDTDDLIESLENKKIKKIFEENGEPYFRNLEKKCALWCEKNVKNSIISTGGGFYKQPNIKNIGTVIYLESTFDKIIEGLHNAPNSKKKFKKRPLLNNLEEARKIFNQRILEYKNVADIIINVEDWDANIAAGKILKEISK
ncbi:shikimate kinase [Arcobacter sp. 15-2]|uniref:shikimate kinase n=1 Tax=Arcobacter sp. 15-2 TaxID=3374109 RepID=UPI00399CA448